MLCKLIESAIQWFNINHRTVFATMQNPVVYVLGARFPDSPTIYMILYNSLETSMQAKRFCVF